jgi:hypothetical protein
MSRFTRSAQPTRADVVIASGALGALLLLAACGPSGEEYIGTISRNTAVSWDGGHETEGCRSDTRTFVLTFYDDGSVGSQTDSIGTITFDLGRPCTFASFRSIGGSHNDGSFTLRVSGKTGSIKGTVGGFSATGAGSLHEERESGGQTVRQHDAYQFRAYR